MIVIHATWQRVALAAIFALPLVLVILLMSPSFVLLPFSEKGRQFALKVLDKGLELAKCILPGAEQSQEKNAEGLRIELPGTRSA
ncbi:hypothetical protein [Nonomuraea sp. NPDC001831]|uniref:hypothetical protein n=1 Tax=Nonomuraea sp. NPDC001831 TaxID=3364340 RepID=UPI0036C4E1AD